MSEVARLECWSSSQRERSHQFSDT